MGVSDVHCRLPLLASVDECKDLAEGCRRIHDIWSTNGSLERCQCVVWGSDSDDTNIGGVEEAVLVECQGITPSNSKGGLSAPEAGAHAEEGGIRDEIDPSPSRSGDLQDKAETQSSRVNSAPGWSREERDQEAPLKKEASGSDPKSLKRLREYKRVST